MMYTNADCTFYLYSKEGKTETYTRFPVEGVYWENVKQSTFLKTGQRDACSALIVVPVGSLDKPINFTEGKDLVVKGNVHTIIDCSSQEALSKSLAAFKKEYEFLTVTTVDERLYGSESVQHYELSCK